MPRAGLFMKRAIPTAGLVVVPKTGHTINLEEPEAFNRIISDFLGAVESGRWQTRNPASLSASAILPAQARLRTELCPAPMPKT